MSKLRIAFDFIPSDAWAAGGTYYRNLFEALRGLEERNRPEAVLVLPQGARRAPCDGLQTLTAGIVDAPPEPAWPGFRKRQEVRLRKALGVWREPESELSRRLRANLVDAVFSKVYLGPGLRVPMLGWIPDWQHMRMPEMFPASEREGRDAFFRKMIEQASRLIVSSRDALRDLETFAPGAAGKARLLPFVARVPEAVYVSDPAPVCERYRLPRRFVYVPNQFWKHKNHEAIVEALSRLGRNRPDMAVVCSGNTNDHRHPAYMGELLAEISRRGLRDRLLVLGIVDRDDVFRLMRQSLAVLQPSLFEGWNSGVEEAKSLGKRILLSDIAVHREQDPPRAEYFDPRDPDALAGVLAKAFDAYPEGPDLEMERQARAALPARMQAFGEGFVSIVREAAG